MHYRSGRHYSEEDSPLTDDLEHGDIDFIIVVPTWLYCTRVASYFSTKEQITTDVKSKDICISMYAINSMNCCDCGHTLCASCVVLPTMRSWTPEELQSAYQSNPSMASVALHKWKGRGCWICSQCGHPQSIGPESHLGRYSLGVMTSGALMASTACSFIGYRAWNELGTWLGGSWVSVFILRRDGANEVFKDSDVDVYLTTFIRSERL
jgi:hypothetical protein